MPIAAAALSSILILAKCVIPADAGSAFGDESQTGQFLWISDAHYDAYYGKKRAAWHQADAPCGGTATGGQPAVLDDAGENMFPYSHFGCGSTDKLVVAMLESAKEELPQPDFILFTGDATRHFAGVAGLDSNQTVSDAINFVYNSTHAIFGDVPVLELPPLDLGNNDQLDDYALDVTSYEPCLIDDSGDLPPATNEWLTYVSSLATYTFANDAEKAVFACGGYIAREIVPNELIVVVLNTIIYSKKLDSDPPIDTYDADPFGQFSWLRSVLSTAKEENKMVYVTGHIPPIQESFVYSVGNKYWDAQYVLRYFDLVDEYQDVVAGNLFGHTHTNELRHIPLLRTDAAPLIVQSAMSPGLGNLPTFTIASYDDASKRITDLSKWTVEWDPIAQVWPKNTTSGIQFVNQIPSVKDFFDMADLSNGEVLDFGRRMSESKVLFEKYWNLYTKGHPYLIGPCLEEPCPRKEICDVMCGVTGVMWSRCANAKSPLADYTCAPPICPKTTGDAYIPSNYWVPPLDKPGMTCENVRLKIPDQGEFSCIPIGEGICRDNGGAFGEWRFGIEEVDAPPCQEDEKCPVSVEPTDTFPVLIDPANTRYPITGTTYTDGETGKVCKNDLGEAIRGCNYAGTTHICISENIESDPNRYSDERPYMFFYDEKSHQYLYQLVCDGIGEEGKLPELKMVNNEDLADATYVNYPVDIVKFKKGATPNKDDANELWKMYMDWNGFEDPDTRRIGKLASFIGVAHPKLCKEYVSPTDKPCWKEDCNDVATPEAYDLDNCELPAGFVVP